MMKRTTLLSHRVIALGIFILAVELMPLSGSVVHATTFGFTKITNNGPDDVSSQLLADVTDSNGQILFKFSNTGPLDSFIAQIYFDDNNSLLSNMTILDDTNPETSLGVSFSSPANPADLPSGNTAVPSFVADLSAGADAPSPQNGVNPSEMVGILFDGNLTNVLTDLNSGALRLGLHVQGIGSTGNSDSFVSVPEPGMAINAMMLLALTGLPLLRRRRR
jgi:MYXO-CTERM domain-containing protein